MSTPEQGQQPDDLVSMRAAAHQVGLPRARIYRWVSTGKLTPTVGRAGRVRYVSLAAARALAAGDVLTRARADGFVPPYEAVRLTGVSKTRITTMARTGKVATVPGPFGKLVCLADVEKQSARERASLVVEPGE